MVAGTLAEMVGPGLNPKLAPLNTTVPNELVSVYDISSVQLPSPVMTTCILPGPLTVGVGLTSTVAVIGVPGQPFAVGVIVKVTVIGALVVLVSVPLIFPEPLLAIPVTVTVLFLVQL